MFRLVRCLRFQGCAGCLASQPTIGVCCLGAGSAIMPVVDQNWPYGFLLDKINRSFWKLVSNGTNSMRWRQPRFRVKFHSQANSPANSRALDVAFRRAYSSSAWWSWAPERTLSALARLRCSCPLASLLRLPSLSSTSAGTQWDPFGPIGVRAQSAFAPTESSKRVPIG